MKNPVSKVNAIHKTKPGDVGGVVIRRGQALPDSLPKDVVESYIKQGLTFATEGELNAVSNNKPSKK